MMENELWKTELKNCVYSYDELKKKISLSETEQNATIEKNSFKFGISPHIIELINRYDTKGAIRKQFIPMENQKTFMFNEDFLNEQTYTVAPNLVQRYPYKAILVVTEGCAAYCRFCTRAYRVGKNLSPSNLTQAFEYLQEHKEIYDIVITGGDPLILDDFKLKEILSELQKIKHIKIIRINTRIPVTIPSRITDDLVQMLSQISGLFINIHFEHPDEIDEKTKTACLKLANAGIPLGSQSVLLKGINDDVATLKELFFKLVQIKIKPYYLYQCDKTKGTEPFWLPPQKGIELINILSPQLPGFAVPKFVVDVPGNIGKSCVAPYGIIGKNNNIYKFKNYYNNRDRKSVV